MGEDVTRSNKLPALYHESNWQTICNPAGADLVLRKRWMYAKILSCFTH